MRSYPFLRRLSSVLGAGTIFLFFASLALAALYLLGNFQSFLDSTQTFLLESLRWSLSFEILCGLWLLPALFFRLATERSRFVARFFLRLFLLLASLAVCSVLLASTRFFQAWFRP
jgi:hypothetical protein